MEKDYPETEFFTIILMLHVCFFFFTWNGPRDRYLPDRDWRFKWYVMRDSSIHSLVFVDWLLFSCILHRNEFFSSFNSLLYICFLNTFVQSEMAYKLCWIFEKGHEIIMFSIFQESVTHEYQNNLHKRCGSLISCLQLADWTALIYFGWSSSFCLDLSRKMYWLCQNMETDQPRNGHS